jgi:hypothetical protein
MRIKESFKVIFKCLAASSKDFVLSAVIIAFKNSIIAKRFEIDA